MDDWVDNLETNCIQIEPNTQHIVELLMLVMWQLSLTHSDIF